MDVVAHRFDICVIDTPPVLSVSTAATLGKQAGSTLMVVKEGEIKEPQLAESLKRTNTYAVLAKIVNICDTNNQTGNSHTDLTTICHKRSLKLALSY